MTEKQDMGVVTQSDREAAVDIYNVILHDWHTQHMLDGMEDECYVIQAFKKHRLASQADQEPAWRPIETAPKGGAADDVRDPSWVEPPRILLRFGDEAVSCAYWDWYYAEGGSGCSDGFAWIEPCSGEPLNMQYTTPPTEWMPLPAIAAARPQPSLKGPSQ